MWCSGTSWLSSPSGKRKIVSFLRRIRRTLCSILHHILLFFGVVLYVWENILSCFWSRAGISVSFAVIFFPWVLFVTATFQLPFRRQVPKSYCHLVEHLLWPRGRMVSPQNIQQEPIKLMLRLLVSNSEFTSPAAIIKSLPRHRWLIPSVPWPMQVTVLLVGAATGTIAGKPARSCKCRLLQAVAVSRRS